MTRWTEAAAFLLATLALSPVIAQQVQVPQGLADLDNDPLYILNQDQVDLSAWNNERLSGQGWQVSQLLDRIVTTEDNQQLGELQDVLIGPDGRIISAVVQTGPTATMNVPWDQLHIAQNFDRITAPADLATEPNQPTVLWTARSVMDHTLTADESSAPIVVQDLIFDNTGELQAVLVTPEASTGADIPTAAVEQEDTFNNLGRVRSHDLPATPPSGGAGISDTNPFDYGDIYDPVPVE